ncbi:hypothetical protein D9M71_570220 [compost metagenome]
MTEPLELTVRAKAAGIVLTLEACIAPAALRDAAGASEAAPALAGTSDETPDEGASLEQGLEVCMRVSRHEPGLILLVVKRDGRVDESYRPWPVDVALEAAGYLIRGSEPPRALFSCRGKLAP